VTDIDGRIVNEFVSGAEVPDIAARYAVPEAYVDRVIEETDLSAKPKRSWTLQHWSNRLAASLLAGLVVYWGTASNALATIVAVMLFVLTTAIVTVARRR
jgi:hypothetical protein